MSQRRYKIALAQFPGQGTSRMEVAAWVVRAVRVMDRDPLVDQVVSLTYADTPIPMLRNRAVRDARAAGCDYLLMVDSDMSPDLDPRAPAFFATAWEFLMARRIEAPDAPPATIAAPYCGPPPSEECYVFHWADHETGSPDRGFSLEMVPRGWAAIKAGIEEVAALPTGLILYDLRVFDVLPPPWFRYEHDPIEAEKATTEDVYQTRNASMLGLPQYCAWDCWAGHVKTKVVGRPVALTRDMVHASLAAAVLRGVDSGDRLVDLPAGGAP